MVQDAFGRLKKLQIFRRKERPRPRWFGRPNLKQHIYKIAVNMADELIEQVQELFEGQIVRRRSAY